MNEQNGKRRCTGKTARGSRCRRWAVGSSDPPLCGQHLKRTYGFYGPVLQSQEIVDLLRIDDVMTLEKELGIVRVGLRRVVHFMNKEKLTPAQKARYAGLLYDGAETVARLVEKIQKLEKAGDGLPASFAEVLDELGEKWGRKL